VLEPPNLTDDEILARVRRRFGLEVSTATFMPEGNDSWAWAFRLDGDGSWFLKVFARDPDDGAVEVPGYLASLNVGHILSPVATVDGASTDADAPFSLVVFPFFEGPPAGQTGVSGPLRTALGRLLRQIHDAPVSPGIDAVMRHERFDVRDADYLTGALDLAPARRPRDRNETAFLATWNEHAHEIRHSLSRAVELSAIAKARPHEMVICHADYHAWNVLVSPEDDFVVVDWDETVVAPRERDLMFVDGCVADLDPIGTDFYAGYGPVDADLELLAYYRHDWVLQEVADYHRRLFDWTLGEATRQEAVGHFTALFGPDDVVRAALDADARIGR